MDFLLIALLTLLNGAFAMSELALASSRKARLVAMQEAGDKGAQAALTLLDNPTQFLSLVQVGITSIGVLNGIIGDAAFSQGLSAWLQGLGAPHRVADISATALVVSVITFITIVFGELVPKRLGQLYPEPIARLVAQPMMWMTKGVKPFVHLLSFCTHMVLKLLRVDNAGERSVTEEEITASLEQGVDAGLIEHHEHQMVRNVFSLDDRLLPSLMMPRADIAWLDANDTRAQALEKIATTKHSWYPVCRDGLDHVVGVVNVTQLLPALKNTALPDEDRLEAYATPAVFVPETLTGMELLEQLRAQSTRIVFVVDEYGVVQGLMTPMDLLEAITGELQGDTHPDAWAVQRADGSWLLDGVMPVAELKARLEIKDLPDPAKGRYNTVAGLLQTAAGRLLATGDCVECAGWRFEVLDLDGKRIDKVLASVVG